MFKILLIPFGHSSTGSGWNRWLLYFMLAFLPKFFSWMCKLRCRYT